MSVTPSVSEGPGGMGGSNLALVPPAHPGPSLTLGVTAVTMLFLLAGCASAPPPPPPPMPTTLPRAVIDSFCGLLHSEGLTSEVRVLKTTQPLITSESLQALADRTSQSRSKTPMSQDILTAPPLPVEIPTGLCVTRGIDAFNPVRDADAMVLRFSVPFPNPFTTGQTGVLARFSLGDESATWYWIPLAGQNGRWLAGRPVMLAVR
jgi:hypothetical protein